MMKCLRWKFRFLGCELKFGQPREKSLKNWVNGCFFLLGLRDLNFSASQFTPKQFACLLLNFSYDCLYQTCKASKLEHKEATTFLIVLLPVLPPRSVQYLLPIASKFLLRANYQPEVPTFEEFVRQAVSQCFTVVSGSKLLLLIGDLTGVLVMTWVVSQALILLLPKNQHSH